MQHITGDPTMDLCARYPSRLGGLKQCRIQSLLLHFYTWQVLGTKPREFCIGVTLSLSTRQNAPTQVKYWARPSDWISTYLKKCWTMFDVIITQLPEIHAQVAISMIDIAPIYGDITAWLYLKWLYIPLKHRQYKRCLQNIDLLPCFRWNTRRGGERRPWKNICFNECIYVLFGERLPHKVLDYYLHLTQCMLPIFF